MYGDCVQNFLSRMVVANPTNDTYRPWNIAALSIRKSDFIPICEKKFELEQLTNEKEYCSIEIIPSAPSPNTIKLLTPKVTPGYFVSKCLGCDNPTIYSWRHPSGPYFDYQPLGYTGSSVVSMLQNGWLSCPSCGAFDIQKSYFKCPRHPDDPRIYQQRYK